MSLLLSTNVDQAPCNMSGTVLRVPGLRLCLLRSSLESRVALESSRGHGGGGGPGRGWRLSTGREAANLGSAAPAPPARSTRGKAAPGGGAELRERPRRGGAPAARSPGAAGVLQHRREQRRGAPIARAPQLQASAGSGDGRAGASARSR